MKTRNSESLQAVEWTLLHWLLCYPFQSGEHLALMLNATPSSVYRHMARLEQAELVEALTPPSLDAGGSRRLYHLSNVGLHLLAARLHTDPTELAARWQTNEAGLLRLLPRLPTLTLLHTTLSSLFAYAPSAYVTPQGHRREVRWHWLRDYRHRFLFRERPALCTADAVLAWRTSDPHTQHKSVQWFSACLLLDTGLDETTLMRDRLECLLQFRECAERWSVYQQFPTVLIFVPILHRAEHWLRHMRELATRMQVTGLTGGIFSFSPLLTRTYGKGVNVWTLSGLHLATGAPCRLHELLHPCTENALLPGVHEHLRNAVFTATRCIALPPAQAHSKCIIRGQFLAGVKAASTEKAESEPNAGLRLGQRYLALLLLLHNHPLLACKELAAILTMQQETVRRYLRTLEHGRYLTLWQDQGEPARWYLTTQGFRLLAATHHVHVLRLGTARPHKGDGVVTRERLPRGLDVLQRYGKHLAGVYGFLAALHTAATEQGERVIWWETGSLCERSYRFGSALHNLRPDAEFMYTTQVKRVRAWLEWDRGTMSRRDLEAKMRAYAHYVRSREWTREGSQQLPLLLFVVPDKGQEERVRHAVTKELAQGGLSIYTTTATRVDEQGPLAAIWRRVHLLRAQRSTEEAIAERVML